MQQAVRRLLGLYPGEGRKAMRFALLAFLAAAAVSGVITVTDGLFLGNVGASGLPLSFLFTAGSLLLFSTIQIVGLNRLCARKIFLGFLLTCTGIFALGSLAMRGGGSTPFHYGAMIAADTIYFMTITALWNFIDQSYDLQDAKRHYGFFSASLILGLATGAAAASLLINPLGASGALLFFASLTGIASLLTIHLMRIAAPLALTPHEEATAGQRPPLLQEILSSRFTLLLIGFGILMGLAEFLMEYTYMDALSGMESNEMTHFLGLARGIVYVADMLLGAVLYSRLLRRLGIERANLVPAGTFALLFAVFPLLGAPMVAVLGLVAVEGALVALYDNNLSLLLNGVPPRIKAQLRVFLQNFIEPLGMLLVAGLLFAFHSHARVVGLGIACVAIVLAVVMRKSYRQAIFSHLRTNSGYEKRETLPVEEIDEKDGQPHEEVATFAFYHWATIQDRYPLVELGELEAVLEKRYHRAIKRSIHRLGQAGLVEDSNILYSALRSENERIHSHAVESLEKSCDARLFRLLLPLVDDRPLSEKVRIAALRTDTNLSLNELFDWIVESGTPAEWRLVSGLRDAQPTDALATV